MGDVGRVGHHLFGELAKELRERPALFRERLVEDAADEVPIQIREHWSVG